MVDLKRFGTCTLEDDGCSTCGDIAVPVRVLRVGSDGVALCEDRVGRQAEIMIEFTPDAEVGDVLLVHMGVSIRTVHANKEVGASP